MRQAIYNYLYQNRSGLKGLTVSDNLPWSENGNPLYLQNKKYVYVDLDQVEQDTLISAVNGSGAVTETTTVRVYFACDAKQLVGGYEDSVALIKTARLSQDIAGVSSRLCQVSTDYTGDVVVTTFEFTFKQVITNP